MASVTGSLSYTDAEEGKNGVSEFAYDGTSVKYITDSTLALNGSEDASKYIVKEDHIQNNVKYRLFSDGTASATGVDQLGITLESIDSVITYDGKEYVLTAIGTSEKAFIASIKSKVGKPFVIPDSVSTVYKIRADNLKSIKIGSGVQTIISGAFGSTALEEVIFATDSTLKIIEDRAFNPCTGLNSIILPDSVEAIGTHVFDSIRDVKVGTRLSSIGINAFGSEIKNIDISAENPYLSFNNKTLYGLLDGKMTVLMQSWSDEKIFDIPDGVVTINDQAFIYAMGIEELRIPASCETIGSLLFFADNNQKVSGLTNVVIGNCSKLNISSNAFWKPSNSTSNLETVVFDPERCNIITIGDRAFCSNASYLKQFGDEEGIIKIPSSTTSIGEEAFYYNAANTILFLNDSAGRSEIKTIGTKAFLGYGKYIKIDLSGCCYLKTVPDSCFYTTSGTRSELLLPMSGSLEYIGENAFAHANCVEYQVIVPASVISIGKGAFSGITSLNFEPGKEPMLEVYGAGAFSFSGKVNEYNLDLSRCHNLNVFSIPVGKLSSKTGSSKTVLFPEGVLLDGKYELSKNYMKVIKAQILNLVDGDTKLNTITITDQTRAIPLYYISDQITSIASERSNNFFVVHGDALYLTKDGKATLVKVSSSLTEFEIPETVSNSNKGNLTTYNVERVCDNAFNGCSLLTDITIGHSLKISDSAFGDCKATILLSGTGKNVASELKSNRFLLGEEHGSNMVYLDSKIVKSYTLADSKISFVFSEGYTTYDVDITVNGIKSTTKSWNVVEYESSDKDLIIKVEPKNRNAPYVEVQFIAEGGVNNKGLDRETVEIPKGMTIIDSDVPYFYKDSSEPKWMVGDVQYDFNAVVDSPIVLNAVWIARDPSITLTSSADGSAIAILNGAPVTSGDQVKSGSVLRIVGEPSINHEVSSWIVATGLSEQVLYGLEIEITVTADTTVTPCFRYYQSSSVLPSITDNDAAPKYSDIGSTKDTTSLQFQWAIGGDVDTSMATWTGGVSIPLIVDGFVYVRQAEHIYKIDSQTGYAVASCPSKTAKSFYHSLAYGNGVIVDTQTGCAFDLDLRRIYTISEKLSSVYYDSGTFYTIIGKTLYGFDSHDSDASRSDEVKTLNEIVQLPSSQVSAFGASSEPVFHDGCLYLLSSDGSSRSIVAVSLEDKTVKSFALTGLESHLFDDGWLTYYNGRIYMTSYVQGLFGDYFAKGNACISSIKVSGTVMSDMKTTAIEGVTSILSKFVIHEGRGYVNACEGASGNLYVYNVSDNGDLEFVYKVASTRSHGSIIVNTSESNEKNNRVTIYLLPYGTERKILFFTDDSTMTVNPKAKVFDYSSTAAPLQYCSQAVRIGLDGQLIWYNDSGQLMSFVKPADNHYYVFVQDGDSGRWYDSTGNTAYDALSKLGDDTLSFEPKTNALKTVNGESADGFRMYVVQYGNLSKATFSEPVEIQNLADSSHNVHHYYIITNGTGTPSEGGSWKYLDDELELSDYTFLYNVGETVVVDRNMAVPGKESVVSFYDGDKPIGKDLGAIGSKSSILMPPYQEDEKQVVIWKGLPEVLTSSVYDVHAKCVPKLKVSTRSDKDGMYNISTDLNVVKDKIQLDGAKNLNVVLALEYDDKVMWSFSKIDWERSASFSYSVSYSDLTSATLMVVDGSSFMNCDMLAIAECDLAS